MGVYHAGPNLLEERESEKESSDVEMEESNTHRLFLLSSPTTAHQLKDAEAKVKALAEKVEKLDEEKEFHQATLEDFQKQAGK